MLVEGGDKYDRRRQIVFSQSFDDTKAIEQRHLHVEKYKIRTGLNDRFDSVAPVSRFADDLNVTGLSELVSQTAAGDRLVVNDQDADLFGASHSSSLLRKGIVIEMGTPPPAVVSSLKS